MKRKIVLSESKFRGLVKNIITEILVNKAYSKFYSDVPEDEYTKIASVDKTRGNHLGAYAKWLLKLYKENKFNLSDINKAKKYISVFDRMAKAGQLKGVDINTFDSIDDMYELVKDNLDSDVITKGDKIRKQKDEGIERIYEDSEWLVLIPKTFEASCLYGANTKWCTASRDEPGHFESYTSRGLLYIIINKKTNRKHQLHFEDNTITDELDNEVDVSDLNLPDKVFDVITKGDLKKKFQFYYDSISDFKNGVAKVMISDMGWNFINQEGEVLFDSWFDWVNSFENGFAKVELDYERYKVDINKRTITKIN